MDTAPKKNMTFLKRWFYRLYLKIVKEKAPPERVAGGWALGMFCGCTIPMGAQLIISVPLAFLFRLSKIGAVVGTLITNHFTVFFIYPAQCYVGGLITGRGIGYQQLISQLKELIEHPTWEVMRSLGGDLMISFFAGGFLMAIVFVPLTYWLVYRTVVHFRATVEARKLLRARLRATIMQKAHAHAAKAKSRTASSVKSKE